MTVVGGSSLALPRTDCVHGTHLSSSSTSRSRRGLLHRHGGRHASRVALVNCSSAVELYTYTVYCTPTRCIAHLQGVLHTYRVYYIPTGCIAYLQGVLHTYRVFDVMMLQTLMGCTRFSDTRYSDTRYSDTHFSDTRYSDTCACCAF